MANSSPMNTNEARKLFKAGFSDPEGGAEGAAGGGATHLSRLEVPGYEIQHAVGQGGMGVVHLALERTTQRRVAIKFLRKELEGSSSFRDRFTREAQLMSRLDHPGLVKILSFSHRPDSASYLVMEYVEGTSLRDRMRRGRMPRNEILLIMNQALDALIYLHQNGIIHRDIKPENILLSPTGEVKISDFGLAKVYAEGSAGAGLSATGVAGTPYYMAPEMRSLGTVDFRGDLYAMGVILYEMATGILPQGVIHRASSLVPLHPAFDDLIVEALQPDPRHRIADAQSFRHRLPYALQDPPLLGAGPLPAQLPPQAAQPAPYYAAAPLLAAPAATGPVSANEAPEAAAPPPPPPPALARRPERPKTPAIPPPPAPQATPSPGSAGVAAATVAGGASLELASFWQRLAAACLDTIILGTIWMPAFAFTQRGPEAAHVLAALFNIAIVFVYWVGLETSVHQATVGKMLLRIKVTTEDGGRMTLSTGAIRRLARYASAFFCGIGYLLYFFTTRRQTLHDLAARTLVVRA